MSTTAEVVAAVAAMMKASRDRADARARTAGRVYSIRRHRAHIANLAARWQG